MDGDSVGEVLSMSFGVHWVCQIILDSFGQRCLSVTKASSRIFQCKFIQLFFLHFLISLSLLPFKLGQGRERRLLF